jgi:hypothetical protein
MLCCKHAIFLGISYRLEAGATRMPTAIVCPSRLAGLRRLEAGPTGGTGFQPVAVVGESAPPTRRPCQPVAASQLAPLHHRDNNARMTSLASTTPRPATMADIEALPESVVGEIIDGVLYTHPRPRPPHAYVQVGLVSERVVRINGVGDITCILRRCPSAAMCSEKPPLAPPLYGADKAPVKARQQLANSRAGLP